MKKKTWGIDMSRTKSYVNAQHYKGSNIEPHCHRNKETARMEEGMIISIYESNFKYESDSKALPTPFQHDNDEKDKQKQKQKQEKNKKKTTKEGLEKSLNLISKSLDGLPDLIAVCYLN